MLDLRSGVDAGFFTTDRTVVQYEFTDISGPTRLWWLVIKPDEVDLCIQDPGFEINLFVTTDLLTLTKAWMGDTPIKQSIRSGAIELHGSSTLARTFDKWMRRSPYANVELPPK